MRDNQESSARVLIIACCGLLSSLVVLFSLHLFFQRSQGDPFFASEEYMLFKERNAVKNIRMEVTEEFVGTVVGCISPQILPGQSLTEQQINERVMAVLDNYSESREITKNKKCENNKSQHWTFALPCKLTINRSPYQLRTEVKLDDMNICQTVIVASIRSAVGRCTESSNFSACLVSSVLANDEVKKEIDKPVEIQAVNSK